MTDEIKNDKGRRSLITGIGVAAAGLTFGASAVNAQTSSGFRPAHHAQDAWMDELSGSHRVFVDSATAHGGAEALLYANNIFNTHVSAYGGSTDDYAMIVCFRHFSTPFAFNDAIWKKYGAIINELIQFPDPTTGEAPTINLLNAADRPQLPNFGNTVDQVGAKGTVFAVCSNATQFISGQIAAGTNATADDVYKELVSSAVANARFVPAGVVALTRAQEYGYSVLIAG